MSSSINSNGNPSTDTAPQSNVTPLGSTRVRRKTQDDASIDSPAELEPPITASEEYTSRHKRARNSLQNSAKSELVPLHKSTLSDAEASDTNASDFEAPAARTRKKQRTNQKQPAQNKDPRINESESPTKAYPTQDTTLPTAAPSKSSIHSLLNNPQSPIESKPYQKPHLSPPDLHRDTGNLSDQHSVENSPENNTNQELIDPNTTRAREAVRETRTEVKQVKSLVESTVRKMYQVKMDELNMEARLLEEDALPEYSHQLAELEAKKEQRLVSLRIQLEMSINGYKNICQAAIKRADDTFVFHRRTLKKDMLQETFSKRIRLHRERNVLSGGARGFVFEPEPLYRRKRAEIDYAEYDSEGVPKYCGNIPEWTRILFKRHKYIGEKPVLLPPFCTGLKEHEKEEDIAFIRMLKP